MKAQDYRNKYKELENQIAKLGKESRSRFLRLCKANPDVVLYSYHIASRLVEVYARDIDKENVQWIEWNGMLEHMKVLEKHIESKNPRKQLEMDFKPECPKIGTCKVTPHHCACDMKDTHTC
jgi:hypothetical protein